MKKFLFPGIIIIIIGILYFNSLSNNFAYDDRSIIVNNSHLKYFASSISSFFNLKYFDISGETTYRPVATLTYFINYQIWKLNPFGYHLFSVFLHIINVLLLYLLLNKLFNNKILSFIICLIYLAHPILTDTVDCISFNEDLLVSTFFILSFLLYLKFLEGHKNYFYIFSLLTFFLSLLSKEMGITLPFIIILYDFLIDDKGLSRKLQQKNAGLKSFFVELLNTIKTKKYIYLGYFTVGIFYLLLLFVILNNPYKNATYYFGNLFTRVIYLPYTLLQYIKLVVFPAKLIAEYDFAYPDNFLSLINIISYLSAAGLIAFSIFIYKYSKKIFFGVWWFLITLLPVLNIIEIYNPVANRYLYLPAIGFCIIIGAFLSDSADRLNTKNKFIKQAIKFSLVIILMFIYSYKTFEDNKVWKDSTALWTDAIKKYPNNANAYNNLGVEFSNKNSLDQGEKFYKKAIELKPDYKKPYLNLGNNYLKKRLYAEAIDEFKKAIELDQNYYAAYYNLGLAYLDDNQSTQAIIQFKKILEKDPYQLDVYDKLGQIYIAQADYTNAIQLFNKAINLDPKNSDFYFFLAFSYYLQDDLKEALDGFLQSIRLSPDKVEAYSKIGELYAKSNFLDKAEEYLTKGIKINPDYPELYFNLGMVYAMQNKIDDAVVQWKKTLHLDPNYAAARENLEKARNMSGRQP